jgi:hypothetical protein
MMVLNAYPNAKITDVLTIPEGTTHLVSVCFNICVGASHFAILYYDIQCQTVSIFDGLNYNLNNWQNHASHTIKMYGLEPDDSNVQISYHCDVTDNDHGKRKEIVLELDYGGKKLHEL